MRTYVVERQVHGRKEQYRWRQESGKRWTQWMSEAESHDGIIRSAKLSRQNYILKFAGDWDQDMGAPR